MFHVKKQKKMAVLIKITVEGDTKIHVFSEDAERAACGYAVVDYCESLDGVSDVQPFKGTLKQITCEKCKQVVNYYKKLR